MFVDRDRKYVQNEILLWLCFNCFSLCQVNASASVYDLRNGFYMDCAPELTNDGEKLEVDWSFFEMCGEWMIWVYTKLLSWFIWSMIGRIMLVE